VLTLVDPKSEKPVNDHNGYEVSDANFKPIIWSALGLAGLVVFTLFIIWVLFQTIETSVMESEKPISPLAGLRKITSQPLLRVEPESDLKSVLAVEDSLLNTYEWILKEAGVVRIPIDHAMELLREKGLAVRGEKESNEWRK